MASEEHHHLVAARDAGIKRLHRLDHGAVVEVFVQHHFKARCAQLGGHGHGIIAGFLQLGDLLVVVIAHHQRDALGVHRHSAQAKRYAEGEKSQKPRKYHEEGRSANCRRLLHFVS